MIDTHCHLSYAPLHDNIDAVLARAQSAGVTHMITIGTRLADCVTCRDLARRYAQISCAVGIHPHHAAEASADELTEVMAMFADDQVIAAGEMGLDYHYDFSPKDAQRRIFEAQLAAAMSARKPLVLHSRESVGDCLSMLKNAGATRGVFHCFTGTMAEAKHILDAGFYLGFTGIITFKNTQYLRDIVKMVPAERLLLETDAPYLSPEPLRRQKHNEPSLIVHVYQRVAQLRSESPEQLAQQTAANARKLFALP